VTRQKTAIVGLGITGSSCVRYLHDSDEVTVLDTRAQPPGLAGLRERYPRVTIHTAVNNFDFSTFDRVLVSPGVALDSDLLQGIPSDVPLVSDIDLFCEAAAAPIIAITGTNGKSTVTSLVGHLLESAGHRAVVGGNLGEAALDLLDEATGIYVLELSSFQLERLAPHAFKVATILNVSDDHLDRHGDMTTYVEAKQRIYRNCEWAVACRGDSATYPACLAGEPEVVTFGADEPGPGHWGIRRVEGIRWLVRGEERVIGAGELPIAGRHNELNVLAAMALLGALDISPQQMAAAVRTFEGLEHRCQRVRCRGGVDYINDSKATNVGAARAALLGFGEELVGTVARVVLIAGGDGKGADFSVLEDVVTRFVKALILIGRDAQLLAEALSGCAEIHRVEDMSSAVRLAARLAESGDLVLLSPACSSLDMYQNFAARGDDFVKSVEALAA